MANPREAAFFSLKQLETSEVFLTEALQAQMKVNSFDQRDRRLLTELVYGSVRWQGYLDYFLNKLSKRPLKQLDPGVRVILRLGAYQILVLAKIPDSASVNESVNLAKKHYHQGIAGLVNGVLRNLIRRQQEIELPDRSKTPLEYISVKYSHPLWLVKLWVKQFGEEEAIRLCEANNISANLTLRTNTLQTSRQELREALAQAGISSQEGRYAPEVITVERGLDPSSDPLFAKGDYYIQDESSVLVGHGVAPQAREIIYDLCSAPGGKSTHLGQLMNNQGQILSIDKYPAKLAKVKENAKRLGINIIQTKQADATKLTGLPLADRVLVDAPCSGLGVIRHKPDIRWRMKPLDIQALAKIQRAILESGAKLVKPGGRLIYSTCTVTEQENQEQIEGFLSDFPDFCLKELPDWFPSSPSRHLQVLPHVHHIDGFFIAVLEKLK